jgi:hypothetical protein
MIPCAARTKQGAVGRRTHERLCFLKRNPPRRRLYSSTFCPHWSSRVLHPEQGNGRGNTGFMNDRRTLALSAVRESKCCLLLVLTRTSPAGLARFRSLRGLTARGGRRRCLRAPLPRQRHPGSRGARRGRRAGRHLEIMLGIMLEGLARVYRLRIHKVVLTHQHMRAHTHNQKSSPRQRHARLGEFHREYARTYAPLEGDPLEAHTAHHIQVHADGHTLDNRFS